MALVFESVMPRLVPWLLPPMYVLSKSTCWKKARGVADKRRRLAGLSDGRGRIERG